MAVAQPAGADVLAQMDEAKLTSFHWRILFISGMGFFTDAYDLFIIGVVATMVTKQWHIASYQKDLLSSLALWPLGMTPLYGLTALVMGSLFVLEAHRLAGRARRGEPVRPMRLFHWSITYLTLLFVAVAVDALIQ